jgi:hypothetical protein
MMDYLIDFFAVLSDGLKTIWIALRAYWKFALLVVAVASLVAGPKKAPAQQALAALVGLVIAGVGAHQQFRAALKSRPLRKGVASALRQPRKSSQRLQDAQKTAYLRPATFPAICPETQLSIWMCDGLCCRQPSRAAAHPAEEAGRALRALAAVAWHATFDPAAWRDMIVRNLSARMTVIEENGKFKAVVNDSNVGTIHE